jgi:DNA-directed RNA polymerase subunit RPC12/RpoP
MTRIGQETIECFACGKGFKRTAVLDIDPHDTRVLGDDTIIREASAIRCPHCGYEETRPLRVRKAIRFQG